MELVYLWVKEYKNIHEQGFNFSSRFNCDYNEKTNELTIEENDDYIPDFFGKNINVTAIVGKNGSGKSSLLEFLLLRKTTNKYIFVYQNKQDTICVYSPHYELQMDNNTLFSESLEKKDIKSNDNIKMIFSFAEYMTRDNHPKHDGDAMLLGQRTNIANYPKEKFNCLLQKLRVNNFDTVEIRDIKRNKLKINNILYKDLSFGETLLISLFINISTKIEKEKLNILFLDEVTLPFHPAWEKRIIKLLTDFFYKDNIHFIITSHSPFLLSDLPKQNIIFLDNYKEEDKEVTNEEQKIGNCKVLSHTEVLSKKQTFGANIHTLLSDSFFMKDGLMGEFAYDKISKIKKFYEKVVEENKKKESDFVSLRKEYEENKIKFEQIQSIIGEPFLKTVIKNYLDEIENILFEDKAKEMAIERFIREFDKDDIIRILNDKS